MDLFAQAPIVQGGDMGALIAGWSAAGLLSMVLGWLFKVHLPAKDKQMDDLITKKDDQINKIISEFTKEARSQRESHSNESKAQRDDFKKALDIVVSHCSDEMTVARQERKELSIKIEQMVNELRRSVVVKEVENVSIISQPRPPS